MQISCSHHLKKKQHLSEKEFGKLKNAYERIKGKLKKNYNKRINWNLPTIFITHNIPYNTNLDEIKDENSYAYGKHFGSSIAKWFVRRYQPKFCVGGHIHEGLGKDKIDKSTIINPGFGQDAQVLIDSKKGIKFYKKPTS